jgi:hypothetical protein
MRRSESAITSHRKQYLGGLTVYPKRLTSKGQATPSESKHGCDKEFRSLNVIAGYLPVRGAWLSLSRDEKRTHDEKAQDHCDERR